MTTRSKLLALRKRLSDEQRALIEQAADAGVAPSASALQRIADLERAVAAEAMIGQGE